MIYCCTCDTCIFFRETLPFVVNNVSIQTSGIVQRISVYFQEDKKIWEKNFVLRKVTIWQTGSWRQCKKCGPEEKENALRGWTRLKIIDHLFGWTKHTHTHTQTFIKHKKAWGTVSLNWRKKTVFSLAAVHFGPAQHVGKKISVGLFFGAQLK